MTLRNQSSDVVLARKNTPFCTPGEPLFHVYLPLQVFLIHKIKSEEGEAPLVWEEPYNQHCLDTGLHLNAEHCAPPSSQFPPHT